MKETSNKIGCACHHCNYVWQYRENSKFIASCPREMTVYIPKMFRLLRENWSKCGFSNVDVKERKILDVESDSSMMSSYNQMIYE